MKLTAAVKQNALLRDPYKAHRRHKGMSRKIWRSALRLTVDSKHHARRDDMGLQTAQSRLRKEKQSDH
jgi:hypothetical protein